MPRDLDFLDPDIHDQMSNTAFDHPRALPVSNPTLSPWQDRPSQYSNYASSTTLLDQTEVCIIGTGLSGISTAWHLLTTDPTIKVTLLEARILCSAASGRNGGHLTCDLYNFAPGLLSAGFTPDQVAAHGQFEIDNFIALSNLIEQERIACEYSVKKHYDVCLTPQELHAHSDAIQCMKKCGGPLDTVQIIHNPLATQLMGATCHAIIEHEYSASINPYALTTGLLERMMSRFSTRLQLYTQTPVFSVQGTTVHTPRGSMSCNHLVFATNGYTSSLLPSLQDVIVPVRGQVLSRKIVQKVENCSFNLGGEYLSQRPTGNIVLGGGRRYARDQEVGNSDDSSLSSEVSKYLYSFSAHLEHERATGKVETREWSGIMGFAKLGIPLVSRLSDSSSGMQQGDAANQYVIAGFTGHGMPRIFLSAKHIASLILRDSGTLAVPAVPVPPGYEAIKKMTRNDLSDH